ncbi:MAG: LuxR C-terminal-related transcriptional regulator [Enhygromyxa sp.]
MAAHSKIRVRFAVERDEQAVKITSLLEALGYEVVRDLSPDSSGTRLRWAVNRLVSKAQLTAREADILELLLRGKSNGEIAEVLEISKATVKWHMHNVFTKTGTTTREALLREALQLGGVARRPPPARRKTSEELADEVAAPDATAQELEELAAEQAEPTEKVAAEPTEKVAAEPTEKAAAEG